MDNNAVIESLRTANEQLEVRASSAETQLKEVEEGCSHFEAEVNKKCDGRVKMVEDSLDLFQRLVAEYCSNVRVCFERALAGIGAELLPVAEDGEMMPGSHWNGWRKRVWVCPVLYLNRPITLSL